jgi:hypothetical protein
MPWMKIVDGDLELDGLPRGAVQSCLLAHCGCARERARRAKGSKLDVWSGGEMTTATSVLLAKTTPLALATTGRASIPLGNSAHDISVVGNEHQPKVCPVAIVP